MDYAIFKTIDNGRPTVIHIFTQLDWNHRAKLAARKKLKEMWFEFIIRHETRGSNLIGTNDDFEYDHMTSVNTKEHVRYFIDSL